MKLTIAFCLLFVCSFASAKKKVESTVDKRVELLSIVFRLAGNPEYNMKLAKNYVADIHSYFDVYKNDPLIAYAKELADKKNIGFSRVMYLAVNLELTNNKFVFIKESESSLTDKWDMEDAVKFVALLNDFYERSKFDIFFKEHAKLYAEATKQFNQSVTEFDQQWYLDYYGDQDVDYKVIIGLSNGGANYGPSVKPVSKKKLVYAIMGSWTFDENGKALFPKDVYLSYLIHEFNHSFVDHLLEDKSIETQLQSSGEILLEREKNSMKSEGYEEWQSVINESIIRASVVRYMIDHKNKEEEIQEETQKQMKKGFVWTKDLVSLLGEYESSRNTYPNFKSFYPNMAVFFKTKTQ
ncbi:DUF4932 domain-containing protein [Flavobacterium sp. N1736]|uniref:DUF4932 domain-containing protein n=1 Tax=Flavobacterium sp. N1736 TaxID=2986823 RepID=UPI0022244C61|nr:DUF4932 domain-containing protein [Flavobacterium sp. N1736]